jgi:hypothetical protein
MKLTLVGTVRSISAETAGVTREFRGSPISVMEVAPCRSRNPYV